MRLNLEKQLTQNFKLKEFLISDFYNFEQQKAVLKSVSYPILQNIHDLADNLQVLRSYLNQPISINIAYRPLWWELQQGRSGTSQHVKGKAADIVIEGMETKKIYLKIESLIKQGKMLQGGLGIYPTFIHYDIRNYKARW